MKFFVIHTPKTWGQSPHLPGISTTFPPDGQPLQPYTPAMATAPVNPNRTAVSRFYEVLTLEQPSTALLDSLVQRVDATTATLGSTLKDIYQSPSVKQGPADDLTRMFFLVFDRAPDALLYGQAMTALRAGATLENLAAIALAFPGHSLSNSGFPDNTGFLKALMTRVFGASYDTKLYTQLANSLETGELTRAKLLALAAGLHQSLAVASQGDVEKALLFLASGNTEATGVDLDRITALDGSIIAALRNAGLSATGGKTAIAINGDEITLYSDLNAQLTWDLAKGIFKLGATTSFQLFYSPDQGVTGSIARFESDGVRDSHTLDASEATGTGKVVFTGHATEDNVFLAPAAGATASGGNGDDVFVGHLGADVFYATSGNDRFTGGFGDDRFVLTTSNVYTSGDNTVSITDFGNGKDVLDLSRLLNKSVDISTLTAILATDITPRVMANGGVVLVENNGAWVNGAGATLSSRPATATDVAALFGDANPFAAPTKVFKSVIITADTVSSADVWLVLNSTDVTRITDGTATSAGPAEVFHVASLDGSWNATLVGLLPTPLPVLLG
jgi:hypothetical protein